MTTSSRPLRADSSRIVSSSGISVSPPSSEKRFWPDVFRLKEGLERLGHIEPVQDVELLFAGDFGVRALKAFLNPLPLHRVGDVHVLDADRAAVGIAQHAQDVAQLHHRHATEPTGGKLAVEIPQRDAVIDDVEVGVLAHLELERVGVSHQVAAYPVGVNQFDDARRLADFVVVSRDDVLHPAHRLVRDAQCAEQVVVEAVFAEQQPMNLPKELTRLRALNNTVVVGRGDGHDLAHREIGQRLGRRALELRGVLHRADADDGALALHEPRHRTYRSQGAGIRQRDRGAGEVVGGELVQPRPPHHVFVRRPELSEIESLGSP